MENFYRALRQVKKMELSLSSMKDRNKFCAILQDLAPEYVPEIRWLKRALENGIYLEFVDKKDVNLSEKKQIVGRVRKRLEIEEGYGEKAAEEIITSLTIISDWDEKDYYDKESLYEIYQRNILIQYLQQAAQMGNPKAQYELGKLYFDGILEQDFDKAYYWWNRAEKGDKENDLKDKLGLEYMRQFQQLVKALEELEYNENIIKKLKTELKYNQNRINELEKKLKSVRRTEKVQVGNVIKFGKYNREWIVLDKKEGKVLILAKKSVGKGSYHSEEINITWGKKNITWEECSLRKWLNEDFYGDFFYEREKRQICEMKVKNFSNPKYGTWGGNDTMDKIFLLSIDEVEKYLGSNKVRAIDSWWWLRSPGYCSLSATVVNLDGVILPNGIATYSKRAIRPALWFDIES